MFETVLLDSPLLAAYRPSLIRSCDLERPLEPFDIWYNGLSSARQRYRRSGARTPSRRLRYPTAAVLSRADIARILLVGLGFSSEARAAELRLANDRRRAGTRLGSCLGGRACEMRQVATCEPASRPGWHGPTRASISRCMKWATMSSRRSLCNDIDHYAAAGCAKQLRFTEALAFVFQGRDFELLGLASPNEEAQAR